MERDRPFCSEASRASGEQLVATASRIDHWILVEYRGLWSRDAVAGSGLSDQVKARLRDLAQARSYTRLLFIRRPDRRGREELVAYVADSRPGRESLARLALETYEDLREADLERDAQPVAQPLFLVCTHGKHDRCCARYGRPLYDALSENLDEESVWQSTHVGGDRFAGNLVCLPRGVYYGRVGRAEAVDILDEHLAGRVALDHYRGRSCHSFAVQAAERVLRKQERLTGLDDLRLRGVRGTGGGWSVSFATPHGVRTVEVTAELGDLTFLTCASEALKRPRRFVATAR